MIFVEPELKKSFEKMRSSKLTREEEIQKEIKEFKKTDTHWADTRNLELLKAELKGIQQGKQDAIDITEELQNPYPKDIFVWDNKEKLKFNRGRFNQHCFEIVENIKKELKSKINNKGDE